MVLERERNGNGTGTEQEQNGMFAFTAICDSGTGSDSGKYLNSGANAIFPTLKNY